MRKILFLLLVLVLGGCSTATKQNISPNQKTPPLPKSNETKTTNSGNQISTGDMKEIEDILNQVFK